MISLRVITCSIFIMMLSFLGWGQDTAYNEPIENTYEQAYQMAYDGDYKSAQELLRGVTAKTPENLKAKALLAKIDTRNGQYEKARSEYNTLLSKNKNNEQYWIAAIKNELYAGENATALGLANKALFYKNENKEIQRLKILATTRIETREYPELGWFNTHQSLSKKYKKNRISENEPTDGATEATENRKEFFRDNRVGVNNSYTVFSERYEPILLSSVSYRYQTKIGSIIPRVNFNNSSGTSGAQYEIDMYPKFLKRFYAYLNYGYSKASIYPSHKAGGDIYVNLPSAIEFSAGGRYTVTSTRNITSITNSVGHYRGNYYFSLRSFITPRPDNLTRFSANILTRKYLKDADNYVGINFGIGYSPELRQTIAGDVLLAETLLFIESQRLSMQYQFTSKNNKNIYLANFGVRRQELAFESNSFFWAFTAGLNYSVKL